MTTLRLKKSIGRSPVRHGLVLITLALGCFALSPMVQAVSPPPDGGYAGQNTAEGQSALNSLATGDHNTAIGFKALFSNTDGNKNTATGAGALRDNITGDNNTATGHDALRDNETGLGNTATGNITLTSNIEGRGNTATGSAALGSNTTGDWNTANGALALVASTTGARNTAIGFSALGNNTTGSFNIALGNGAGTGVTTADDVICIGAQGANVSHTSYIGNIFNQTSVNGMPVLINSDNKLGTTTSSKRFKEEIKPMNQASEALFALKPVKFHYKKEIDPACTSQFGLVAEDVLEVNPDLVVRDEEGKPYSVRYDQVNAMLLNEFLKEHRTVQDLKSAAAKQEAMIARQQKQIEALTAGLQKVSAQVQMSRPAPQTVANNQ